jgi:hypothetical protein
MPSVLCAHASRTVPAVLWWPWWDISTTLACAASGVTALVPLRRVASAGLVLCGAEQRFDQRAERQPPHGIHGICPAPLVTETADTRIIIGLEGRGNTGLSYRFGYLHVDVHAVGPPFRHTSHRQVCRTEAPRTSSAASRCGRSGSARRMVAILRPPAMAPVSGMHRGQHARALQRSF